MLFLPDSRSSEHVEPCAGTLWKMRDGAISAPFSVFRRNMGQDDALRRKPGEKENCVTGRENHPTILPIDLNRMKKKNNTDITQTTNSKAASQCGFNVFKMIELLPPNLKSKLFRIVTSAQLCMCCDLLTPSGQNGNTLEEKSERSPEAFQQQMPFMSFWLTSYQGAAAACLRSSHSFRLAGSLRSPPAARSRSCCRTRPSAGAVWSRSGPPLWRCRWRWCSVGPGPPASSLP